MSLREFLVGELIDIIEWIDDSDDTMAWRFSRPGNDIKNGAQLIVRVKARAIFPNCPRYIPRMAVVEPSIYASRAGSPGARSCSKVSGSTGLTRWWSNPASLVRWRFSLWPQPVIAIRSTGSPRLSPRSRRAAS